MTHATTVRLPPDQAFARFTERMPDRWPPEYTWTRQTLEAIAIEPRDGGRCNGREPHGWPLPLARFAAVGG